MAPPRSSSREGTVGGESDAELAQLHRKYKMMENNSAKYTEESQAMIKQQRKAIDKVKKDNEKLKDQLKAETQTLMKPNDAATQAHMARLQDQADLFLRKIELEKRRAEESDKQCKVLSVKLLELQQQRGGVNASRQNDLQVQKQIRILENRLDKALVKFNESLSKNKSLREEIDNLRRERVVFDQINARLAKELHEKKKQMAQIIEMSNIAYESRDQTQNEMALLRAHADKEQAQFEGEWRELGRLLEQDRKLKDRVQDGARGKMTMEEEGKLKKHVVKGNWALAKEKAAQKASLDRVQSFEEAFQQIKAATGIENIDELVHTFIDAEDQNFSLFNYVNELNNEVEKLEEQIAEIRGDIDKYKGQGGHNDRQRKKLLKDLEDRLATTEARAEQYEARAQKAAKTVTQLEQGIQSIFGRIGCDRGALSEMLGSTGVTESNMMQYLGIIEQRTNELLQHYREGARTRADASGGVTSAPSTQQQSSAPAASNVSVLGAGPQAPVGKFSINIEPPTIGDDERSDDGSEEDEERPLSRDELRAKTLRGLNKREGQKPGAARSRKARGKR